MHAGSLKSYATQRTACMNQTDRECGSGHKVADPDAEKARIRAKKVLDQTLFASAARAGKRGLSDSTRKEQSPKQPADTQGPWQGRTVGMAGTVRFVGLCITNEASESDPGPSPPRFSHFLCPSGPSARYRSNPYRFVPIPAAGLC